MNKIILYLILNSLLFSNTLNIQNLKFIKKKQNEINKNFFINNRIDYFNKFVKDLKKIKNEKIIIKKVNSFVNEFKYKSDLKNYNKNDYWQTPKEMIVKDSGDCEDFALTKYIILKKFINEKKLKLALCKVKNKEFKNEESHMVLIYNNKFVLDNLNKNLLKIEERKDLNFILFFDLNQNEFYKTKIKEYKTRLNDFSNSILIL